MTPAAPRITTTREAYRRDDLDHDWAIVAYQVVSDTSRLHWHYLTPTKQLDGASLCQGRHGDGFALYARLPRQEARQQANRKAFRTSSHRGFATGRQRPSEGRETGNAERYLEVAR